MRATALTLGLAAALAVPAAASGASTGPYAGSVRENEVRVHHYDNHTGRPCPDIVTRYTVTLTSLPPSDALQLAVAGEVADTEAGVAAVTFTQGVCTAFDIRVAGVAVGGTATYAVAIVRDSPLP